jgi:hypothetical protein
METGSLDLCSSELPPDYSEQIRFETFRKLPFRVQKQFLSEFEQLAMLSSPLRPEKVLECPILSACMILAEAYLSHIDPKEWISPNNEPEESATHAIDLVRSAARQGHPGAQSLMVRLSSIHVRTQLSKALFPGRLN